MTTNARCGAPAVIALLPLLLTLHAAPPASVLVWSVEMPRDVPASSVALVNDALTGHVRKSEAFTRVHSHQDLQDLLEKAPRDELFACVECIEAIQRALRVDVLLATRVSLVDGKYAVSMKLLDLKSAEVLASITEIQADARIAPLVERLPALFARMMLELHLRQASDVVDGVVEPEPPL